MFARIVLVRFSNKNEEFVREGWKGTSALQNGKRLDKHVHYKPSDIVMINILQILHNNARTSARLDINSDFLAGKYRSRKYPRRNFAQGCT